MELKPCQCGQEVTRPYPMTTRDYDGSWWEISCSCGRKLKSCTEESVIHKWNSRPTEDRLTAENEALRKRVRELELLLNAHKESLAVYEKSDAKLYLDPDERAKLKMLIDKFGENWDKLAEQEQEPK